MAILPKREVEICKRLREFRELKRIARSKFAVSIGLAPERLASYESGRAPLRYAVVKQILKEYPINPIWLATGRESPCLLDIIDDVLFPEAASRTALFSEVFEENYDAFKNSIALQNYGLFERLMEVLRQKDSSEAIQFLLSASPEAFTTLRNYNLFHKEALDILGPETKAKKRLLTDAATSDKPLDVKAQLPSLLERLKKATSETGKMSALAEYLGVPLASVSRWLSGKREPGGEITLKLLHWVEWQERKK